MIDCADSFKTTYAATFLADRESHTPSNFIKYVAILNNLVYSEINGKPEGGEIMLGFYLSMLETDEEKDRFEKLYRMFKGDMYAVAYGVLKNKEDAEDAVHQSFIEIADNFKKVNEIPCQEIKAYIVVISRNTAINMYNKRKRVQSHSIDIDVDEIPIDIDMLEDYDHDRLVNAISELPDIYKDILFLYCLEGFSAKEVAEQLGVNTNTVWKRFERAKRLLKENLDRNGEYEKQ